MGFSSIPFLFYFLPVFITIYFAVPSIYAKNLVLLGFSMIFYAWGEPTFILVLLGSVGLNLLAALWIDKSQNALRKQALIWAVCGNLLLLFIFKYTVFAASMLGDLTGLFGFHFPLPRIALPLGISFFTFHSLSYLIDVYRRQYPAVRDPSTLALYILLFPQLVAGPIVRYKTIARQLQYRRHTMARASAGARIFVIGLAQKVMIADQVSIIADAAFNHATTLGLSDAWLGLFAYSIQIYFDFAGYSNMAIGLGVVLGFTFPRNFRMPYSALSITDFWRRWHMSLSSWLRDYLYFPLGGSYGSQALTYRNLVVVFVLCGLWHGASWNFFFWGIWHGTFLVVERIGLGKMLVRRPVAIRWAYTMLVVMGGWVLFRAEDLASALNVYGGLIGFNGPGTLDYEFRAALHPLTCFALTIGCVLAVLPPTAWRRQILARLEPVLDPLVTFALLVLSVVSIGAGTYSPFLYFRF